MTPAKRGPLPFQAPFWAVCCSLNTTGGIEVAADDWKTLGHTARVGLIETGEAAC